MSAWLRRGRRAARDLMRAVAESPPDALPPPGVAATAGVAALRAASAVYALAADARAAAYASGLLSPHRLPLPVVSVGNVTWGGSGKTPAVEHLARLCLARGAPPLLLTRGYGGGDEARMLRRALAGTPARVATGADRRAAALAALATHSADGDDPLRPAVALLDDGLQHHALARDVELVCVNAVSLWGSGRRVPAGPLRESPAAALRRAHVVLAHNWSLASAAQRAACDAALDAACAPSTLRLRSELRPAEWLHPLDGASDPVPLAALRGARVLALTGLGSPASFEATLRAAGADDVVSMRFPDHHAFDAADVAAAAARLPPHAWLVTSAKDAARGDALREGLAWLGRRALVMHGRLRLVAPDGCADDVAGAAALDALLAPLLVRTQHS